MVRDKCLFRYTDPKMGEVTCWIARELDYPVKFEQRGVRVYVKEEYSNIKTGGMSDSLFEIPSGYQIMRMF